MTSNLTKEQIDSCLRIGSLEHAANEEYYKGRYDPEKGGPALKALNEARKEHKKLFDDTARAATVEEHAAHGRRFFSGADCMCPCCVEWRRSLPTPLPSPCPACLGTEKILEDHDGRAGYRPCTECT